MRVSLITTSIFPKPKTKTQRVPFKAVQTSPVDRVELSNKHLLNRALSKLNVINKAEYDSLSEVEKNALRAKLEDFDDTYIKKTYKQEVKVHHYAAEAIKTVFDKQYGEGNYVVIPVGRSLSSIGKMLALKIGQENVKNLPMSNMQGHSAYGLDFESYKYKKENIEDVKGGEKYKSFLEEIGLTKEAVNNSGKHYILMDYTASGNSLEGAYTMLTSDYFLGNDKRNITTAPIADVLWAIERDRDEPAQALNDLDRSEYKDYSFVNHTGYDFAHTERDWNMNCFCRTDSELNTRKLFGFALMDSEFTGGDKAFKNFKIVERKGFSWDNDKEIPGQTKSLWSTPLEQFNSDIGKDAQELYRLAARIEKPYNELIKKQSKYENTLRSRTSYLTFTLEKKIQEKFPLEFEYYSNQKKFERMSELVSKSDIERNQAAIYREAEAFGKKSEIYKFIEDFDTSVKNFGNEKNALQKREEIFKIKKAKNILSDFDSAIKKFKLKRKDESKPYEIRAEYYKEFRPRLLNVLSIVNNKYTPEYCKEYIQTLETVYEQAFSDFEKKNTDFAERVEKKLKRLPAKQPSKEFQEIVEAQRAALENTSECMFPF